MIFEGYFIVNTIFSVDNVASDTCSGHCLEEDPDTPPKIPFSYVVVSATLMRDSSSENLP
jgi:hypothetical protein